MRKSYEDLILTALLDKYERSGKARGIDTGRAVQLKEKDVPSLFHYALPEEKRTVFSALDSLKSEGILSYFFIPGEEGYIIDRIVLNEENADKAFRKAGRQPLQDAIRILTSLIDDAIREIPDSNLRIFLENEGRKMSAKKTLDRRFFSASDNENSLLMKTLTALAENQYPLTKRVFSAKYLGGSKVFEEETEAAVMRILRAVHGRDIPDEDILTLYGVTRYPEVIEFRGLLSITMADGASIDFSPLCHGAYINTETIAEIKEIRTEAERVISIENKANYIDWIRTHHDDDEIVIWHGGFYSPMKGQLMKMIAGKVPQWRHASDIDIGGFRIFRRLQENIAPQAEPYMMDSRTLIDNLGKAQKAGENYLKELRSLLDDKGFAIFHDTIRTMLEYGVRLEQEALLS